jgi:hypothetical protein
VGGRGGEGTAELKCPAEERGRHGNRGEEGRWLTGCPVASSKKVGLGTWYGAAWRRSGPDDKSIVVVPRLGTWHFHM